MAQRSRFVPRSTHLRGNSALSGIDPKQLGSQFKSYSEQTFGNNALDLQLNDKD